MPAVEIYNRFIVFEDPAKPATKPATTVTPWTSKNKIIPLAPLHNNRANTRVTRSRAGKSGKEVPTTVPMPITIPDVKPDTKPFLTLQSVQVKIELGHKAELRRKHSIEGFTHDWTIFVRGPEGSNIQHFVEKVIFYLHDSFPKPKRVKKEPPYQVSESGYGSFNLPVEIYFKTKEEPRKIRFDYDLFLHLDGAPPVNHTRCEKLTFKNPTEEFRRKLIAAGGVGILSSHEGLVQPSSQRSTTTTAITPQTAESKAFNDLFGAPIHAPTAPAPEGGAAAPTRAPTMAPSGSSEGKHKHHGDGHKKHKSHKDKDKDRDHRKKSKSSKSHSSGGGGTSASGSQPVTSTPKVSPHTSAGASQQPQPAKKHSSEEPTAALSDVPAKKKKKDKDKDAERSKSSSRGHSSERHEKPHKSSSKPDKPTASVAPTTSHDKSSSSSKDKHRHSSTSSKSHHKSKKSHKEKHHHHHRHHDNSSGSSSSKHHSSSSHSKTAETESRSPAKLSPAKSSPAKLSPVKSSPAAKSPVKEPRSQSGYKKPKSIQDKPAPSLPPLEFSTGELSDDPFDEEPATRDDNSEDEVEITDVVVSPDARNTSQPTVPDIKVDNRSKDFMKALFDEMDSDEEDDDEEDMDVEVVTPKASPVVIVDSLPAALSPLHPSPKATPAMLSPSPRSHTLSPKPARGLSPQKTPENKPSESSSQRNKSHTSSSPSNVSPLTSSSSSSQRPSVDPSRKHNKSRESSSSVKSKPPTESSSSKQPSSGSRSRREQPVEQHEATKRKSSMDPTSNQDPWGGSPQSGGRNRSREERQESWQSASNTASSNSLLASSKSKISPPRFSMDPPDLLKSTQHSDFGFQASQQRNVPDLEKENQGVENHHNNATTGAVTKAPLLENGTDLPETIPGHAPNGETFDLLLWLQDKLNATKDEAVLSEVVRILEDSGEVFSMTDSSLDFDLCYLNSNTVHRLKTCLQMA